MLNKIKQVFTTFVVLCYANLALAQTLPSQDLLTGSTGITYTTPNTWQDYTYTFTPTTTGANYVGFAFRQDPAYWTLGNVSLSTGGGTNLLINGNFATGGSFDITTSNGPSTVQAPQYWGVWYQNGTYPAAAGSWYAPGTGWNPSSPYNVGQGVNTSTAGSWIDGAVGSFDGIYQGINLLSGTLYSLSFSVYGNTAVYSGVQLGVYAGVCANATLAANLCTMPSNSGFTTLATPDQGSNAGQPAGPTTYSEVSTGNTVTADTMAAGTFTGNGGTLQIVNGSTTISNDIVLSNGSGLTVDQNSQDGTLTGTISGSGDLGFINSGTGGSITLNGSYTYTGGTTVGEGVSIINNSDLSSSNLLTNNGMFSNNGTVGTVTNFGTFSNNIGGTTGNFNNAGVLINYGTVDNLSYNNYMVNNHGIINTVTYNGGYVYNYSDGTIGSINNTEAHGYFSNEGTVTGNVTTNSTFDNYGNVNGTFTNNGNLTHYSGTINSLVNNGTFTTGSTTLGSYTQSSTGVTNLGGTLNVTGTATLDGTLNLSSAPTSIGRYNILLAGSRVGQFATLTGSTGRFVYTSTGLDLWIMPDGTVVQAQVNALANNLSNMNSLASGSITGAVGSDCLTFGDNGVCLSANYGNTNAASGDLKSAGITMAKKINNNWRVGVVLGQQLNNPIVNTIKYSSNSPAVGGFVGWNKNTDGTGLGITASTISGTGNYTIGTDKTGVKGEATQIKATYAIPVTATVTITPYAGIRRSQFKVNGYTEQGPVFPLTYSAVNQSTTDALAGATVSKKFTERLAGSVSAGVVQNISRSAGQVNSTSEMGNYSAPLQGSRYTSSALGAGLSYEIAKNQRIGANFGWQQKSLTNSNISSYGVSYTVGF